MTGRALILGLGRFGGGRAAAESLAASGFALRIADRAAPETLAEARQALAPLDTRIEWRLGGDLEAELLDGIDLVVVNPAVRPDHPILAEAARRGVPTTQEINLFVERFPGRIVLVTGTNGKSTTATLLARCLARAGERVELGGNIGRSLLETVDRHDARSIAVVEISSAQLTRLDPARHRVHGAVAARITRDHIDWHGSLAAYHAAKQRALEAADEFVVHAADDEVAGRAAARARRLRFRSVEPGADEIGVDAAGWLVSRVGSDPGRVLHGDASLLVGRFHLENLAAACAAARALGVPRATAGLALGLVRPLRHRLQLVGAAGGRRLYDNSVSTEVQSTVSALDALGGAIHWVGGGKSKDGDFAGVAAVLAPRIASAQVFGAAAPELAPLLAAHVPTSRHERLEAALDAAWQRAAPGDAVLFSPAFASFDQFSNFRERAAVFEAWAARTLRSTPE